MSTIVRGNTVSGAMFDAGQPERFRYQLWRAIVRAEPEFIAKGSCLFIMLNPSTADESVLDPTVRRCYGFAREWGYDRLEVCNLFAVRSTDPSELYKDVPLSHLVGHENDRMIQQAVNRSTLVVCAWGVHGVRHGRSARVLDSLKAWGCRPKCLGKTKDGHPRHPLYLRTNTELEEV